jgi:hypothetical protein
MRVTKLILNLFLFIFISIYAMPESQADWRQVPDAGPGKCVANCGGGGESYTPGPVGPSPQELKRQREAKDLNEAADDANDKGVDFYNKGDWENAIKYFREALEYNPDNQDYRNNLQRAQQKANDAVAKRELPKSKAFEEAQSNLYHTQQGTPGAVFDTKAANKSVPLSAVTASGQPIQMSEKARKDRRMIKEQKELAALQDKRQKLDAQRTQLAKERNSAVDPEKMKQLTKKLDKAEKDYQGNLLLISKKTEKIEKLKRTIDTEVEKPSAGGPKTKEGAK